MNKYISIKDGYSCKKENPYDEKYKDAKSSPWKAFESTNHELPLTEHVEVGIVFEGGEVWMVKETRTDIEIIPELVTDAFVHSRIDELKVKFPHLEFYIAIHPANWVTVKEVSNVMEAPSDFFKDDQTLGEGEKESNGWISVEDRLPSDFTSVNKHISATNKYLIYDKTYGIEKAWLKRFDLKIVDKLDPHEIGDTKWEATHASFTAVTHWQPLPSPPKL